MPHSTPHLSTLQDYDQLALPVARRLLFAGEHTCKEHPDTVGGAMMTGKRGSHCTKAGCDGPVDDMGMIGDARVTGEGVAGMKQWAVGNCIANRTVVAVDCACRMHG